MTVEKLLQQASELRQQKNWEEFSQVAQKLKNLHKEEGYLFYCEALLAQNKFEEADSAGDAMLKDFPSSQTCLRRYVEITLRGGDWPRTRQRAEKLRDQFPADPFGWHAGCTALREMRRFEEAEELCAVMLKKFPSHFECLRQAVLLAQQSGNFASMLDRAEKMQKEFPQRWDGGHFRCLALCELEDYEAADNVARRLVETFPGNIHCLYRYVQNAIHACNWSEVILRAEAMLKIFPDHIDCMLDLATAFSKTNQYQSFESIAETICQKSPQTSSIHRIYTRLATLDLENGNSNFWNKKLMSFSPSKQQKNFTYFSEIGPNGLIATFSLLKDLHQHIISRNARLYICFYPLLSNIIIKDEFEYALSNRFRTKHGKDRYQYDYFSSLFSDIKYSNADYLKSICTVPEIYTNANGGLSFKDKKTQTVNTYNGKRITCYQQSKAKNKIFICGSCVAYGYPVEDKFTIQSWLQKRINKEHLSFNVYNIGFPGSTLYQLVNNLTSENISKGDIIILIPPSLTANFSLLKAFCFYHNITIQDFSHIFANKRSCYGKVFTDNGSHLTHKGNELFADTLFENLIKYNTIISNSKNIISSFTQIYLHTDPKASISQDDNTQLEVIS